MTLTPKVGIYFSIFLAIAGCIAGLGASFADLGLSPAEVKGILAGDAIILSIGNAINAALHMIPASTPPTTTVANQFPLGPKV